MSSKSKDKGNRFEYEVRDKFIDNGIECKRAYASDGRALGYSEGVDLLAIHNDEHYTIQCKVRKRIASFFKPLNDVYAQVLKQDRDITYAVVRLDDLIALIKSKK